MHRFIPGLAKLPEKRKITQIEKRQRDCVYDRCKRNLGYIIIKEWEEYAWLAYDDEQNAMTMFCSSTLSQVRVVGVGKIPPVRLEPGNNAFATDERRTSKVSGGLVIFFVY